MKILISETIFDSSIFHQKWYNGETYGGKVVEVDDEYSDCCKEDFDGFVFNVEKYNARKLKENNKVRIIELKTWFNTTYRYKDEKYNRLITLDKLDDDGVSPEIKRKELYKEAENVRVEIQRLEEELNNDNN